MFKFYTRLYQAIPLIIHSTFNVFLSILVLLVIVLIRLYYNYYFGNQIQVDELENTISSEIIENYNSSNIINTLPEVINTLPEVINNSIPFEEFEWKWRPMGKLYPYCNYNLFEFKQVELYWDYFDHLILLSH